MARVEERNDPIANTRSDKVSDRVARLILEDILQQRLGPGDMLPPETQMLARYPASRASLREALRILEVHGIIRMKPGPSGGPQVVASSARDFGRSATLYFQMLGTTMHELLEALLVIEPMMARQAAERLTDEGAAALLRAVEQGQEVKDDPGPGWLAASSDFHQLIGRLTGNRILSLFSESLVTIQKERLVSVGRRPEVLRTHAKIAEAIIARDGDEAERLMAEHLEERRRRILKQWPGLLDQVIEWR